MSDNEGNKAGKGWTDRQRVRLPPLSSYQHTNNLHSSPTFSTSSNSPASSLTMLYVLAIFSLHLASCKQHPSLSATQTLSQTSAPQLTLARTPPVLTAKLSAPAASWWTDSKAH